MAGAMCEVLGVESAAMGSGRDTVVELSVSREAADGIRTAAE